MYVYIYIYIYDGDADDDDDEANMKFIWRVIADLRDAASNL